MGEQDACHNRLETGLGYIIRQAQQLLDEIPQHRKGQVPTPAEMADFVIKKLGRGKAARTLELDSGTVGRWRHGGRLLKKNLKKLQALYDELFGKEE